VLSTQTLPASTLFAQSVTNIQFGACTSGDIAVSVEMEADTATEEIAAGRFRTYSDRTGELEIWNYELYAVDVTVYLRCLGTSSPKGTSISCTTDPDYGTICSTDFLRTDTTFIELENPSELNY
jgi:hypothetical protein